jgi:hypothetical protein
MDQAKIQSLAAAEEARFEQDRPRSIDATARAARTMSRGVPMAWMDELYDHPPLWVSHGAGSRFWDIDGHEYVSHIHLRTSTRTCARLASSSTPWREDIQAQAALPV